MYQLVLDAVFATVSVTISILIKPLYTSSHYFGSRKKKNGTGTILGLKELHIILAPVIFSLCSLNKMMQIC